MPFYMPLMMIPNLHSVDLVLTMIPVLIIPGYLVPTMPPISSIIPGVPITIPGVFYVYHYSGSYRLPFSVPHSQAFL